MSRPGKPAPLQADGIRRLVPWRHPFLMIDRMLECDPNRRILTAKDVTDDDPLERRAGGPGRFLAVLLVEGLSQSAGLLLQLSYEDVGDRLPLLGHFSASFAARHAVAGDCVQFDVRAVKMSRTGGVFEGEASVSGVRVASAELAFSAPRADDVRTK